jgi:hypothetical protein
MDKMAGATGVPFSFDFQGLYLQTHPKLTLAAKVFSTLPTVPFACNSGRHKTRTIGRATAPSGKDAASAAL